MSGDLRVLGGVDPHGRPCEVLVLDGRVAALADAGPDVPVLDAEGAVVAPGLVDLQVNGAAGVDVTAEPERLEDVAAVLPASGVTSFLPTVITSPADRRDRAMAAVRRGAVRPGARVLGLHLEGPMLAPARKGAHPVEWLCGPGPDLVRGWSRDTGVVMVTLAPELPGALDVVRELVSRGVVVSVGHTDATTEQVEAAVDAGATCVTHLFNAMPGLGHRSPGPVGVALGGSDVIAGVIADGHHVDPLVLAAAWRALGPERFLTVSDTTAALGLPEGRTVLGDQEVVVAGGTVRLPDGTLAGSAASLLDGLRGLLAASGCTLADALATVTTTPARVLGDPALGRLEPGGAGDLVLLDATAGSVDLVATVVGGAVLHDGRR